MFSNTRSLTIEWGHCDPAGIVFNPQYFAMFDWSTWQLFHAALSVNKKEMQDRFGTAGGVVVETRAVFRAPCRYCDEVEIISSFVEIGRSSFRIEHKLWNRGVLSVEGFETRVWTARDPDDPQRLKSVPIPEPVVRAISVSRG